MPPPLTRADALGEVGHLAQHRVHLRDDVLAVDDDRRVLGRAQRGVQHGAILGDVDLVAAEHRVDALTQARPAGQLEEQTHGLVGDAVLRVVEVETLTLGRETLAPLRVGGEEVAQVRVAHLLEVLLERVPLGGLGDRHLPSRHSGRRSPRLAAAQATCASIVPRPVRARTPPAAGARPR